MEEKKYKREWALEITDLDIPPIRRTEANLWRAKYWEMHEEVRKANKGIRRLKYSNEKMKDRLKEVESLLELELA